MKQKQILELSNTQKGLLLALCLGDGCLRKPHPKTGAVQLEIGHSIQQLEYCKYKRDLVYSIFGGKNPPKVGIRNIKVNKIRTDNKIEFSFNSVPYSFIFEFNIFCRGMNELASLIEIILPNFNPNLSLDIYDVANLDEPTRVPLKLMDVTFSEVDENSETSKNIWMLTFSMQMDGQLYQQIKTTNLLREYDMLTNVNRGYNYLECVNNPIYSAFFKKNTLKKGENTIEVVFKSALDIPEISFEISDNIKFKQKSNKIVFTLTDDILSKLQNNFVFVKCNLKTASDSLSISNKFLVV